MGESSEALPYALVSQLVPWLLSHIHRPSFTNNSSSLLISFYLYIFMVASILEPTQIIHILKNPKFTSLNFQVFFRQFSSQVSAIQYNNGFSSTWYQKGIICWKPSIFKSCGGAKGLSCSLCWRENEAVCDPDIILDPIFIPRLVESSWGRVWIWSSHGRPYNSLQRRCLPKHNFPLEWTINLVV